MQNIQTPLGVIRVKVAFLEDKVINIQPEYEDCVTIAQREEIPLREIQEMIIPIAFSLNNKSYQ